MSCPQGIYVKGNSDIEVRSSEIMMINAMQAAVTENNREDHPLSGGSGKTSLNGRLLSGGPKEEEEPATGEANAPRFGNSERGGPRVVKILVRSGNQRGPHFDAGKVKANLTLSGLGAGLC